MSKNYLITGACRGIGRGLSRLLLQKGHRVFLLDNNQTEIEHMQSQIPKWLPQLPPPQQQQEQQQQQPQSRYQIFRADLASKSDIELAADSASVFFDGKLDVLINNAAYTTGVIHESKFDTDAFLDLWHTSLAVNLTGGMLLTRACLPLLKKSDTRPHGGSVIFMSSTRAYQSEPHSEAYATTKAGLLGLSQALSCSLAEDNVKVNAVLPGWINVAHESKDGDDNGVKWEDGISADDHRWHFAGRVGKVEDILRAIEYFAQTEGDGDGFVTGQECVVDGGVTRRMVYPE